LENLKPEVSSENIITENSEKDTISENIGKNIIPDNSWKDRIPGAPAHFLLRAHLLLHAPERKKISGTHFCLRIAGRK
jgi:hypothetical protein